MATEKNLLRLVIAEESRNDAEHLINVLRNAGFAVRAISVEDEEALQTVLSECCHDLFICAPQLEQLPLESAAQIASQSDGNTPLLVLNEHSDPELRLQVMRMGALDLVDKSDAEHFRLVVEREVRNLRERRRLYQFETALRETERRCHALLDNSRDAIAYVHEGMHIYANAAYLERFGMDRGEAIEGMPILDLIAVDDQAHFKDFLRRYSQGKHNEDHLEISIRGPKGETQAVVMHFSGASIDGEPCTQILMRGKATGLEQELANLSRRDMLTGLFNRKYFLEQLDRSLAEQPPAGEGASLGLLYLQIDNLEAAHASLGITSVELVLSDIARLIEGQTGENDIAAHYANAVFTILLPNRTVHEAIGLAEALRQSIEEHVSEADNRTITKSCSIGIAMLSEGGANASQAINLAAEASEAARREGGNRIHLHATAGQSGNESGSDWKSRLEHALADEAFYLVYQPMVSLSGDQTERYETRLRLSADNGQFLAPRDFMPFADQCGLTPAIDRWLTQTVLAAIAQRRAAGHEPHVFIKITGGTLGDPEFLPFLTSQLERLDVKGTNLVFELSEPVAMTQLKQAKAFRQGVKELGCSFALDQFGREFNSFQLLKHIPADYLKLDRSLCVDLTDSVETQRKLRQIVDTAHTMGKQVIAGFLEEATALATLWQYKVDLVQGHFLQEPVLEMNYDFSGMVI
ncbi:EAL domain-containing response regulator [Nitrococcus mobilis]|uniref:Multisensor diguanylate cyclase/phosphodiesterase n=1 Tax=Nitrococcus mobilis Nb-231 TaxID=314278 RepID=A4BSY6_9GAMM|nr:EAL domain-containing protein [Nitrococcus mobilis]EAR21230.1 multisensor diguanylate cyclase/phosphodiesterase [Nitrococcus mobilis Nb-231]